MFGKQKTGKARETGTRGQILSLDFVISLILVFLALGIALNFFELHTVSAKEEQLKDGLYNIGESASRLLVSSGDIACELVNERGQRIDFLPNCLGNAPNRITKQNLGIPSNFECAVIIDSALISENNIAGCQTTSTLSIPANADTFSATRKIAVIPAIGSHIIKKKALEDCISGRACSMQDTDATIMVWRQ